MMDALKAIILGASFGAVFLYDRTDCLRPYFLWAQNPSLIR